MKNIANYNFSAHKCDFKKRKSFLKAVCQTEACQQDFFFHIWSTVMWLFQMNVPQLNLVFLNLFLGLK